MILNQVTMAIFWHSFIKKRKIDPKNFEKEKEENPLEMYNHPVRASFKKK